ncbi:MAG: GatB/YqeY domain-containing protein, partial [Nitrospinales bacterium]
RRRKDQFLINILSALYAEAAMVGKNDGNRETTDSEVVGKVKAFIKNIDETLKSLDENSGPAAELLKEKTAIGKYLPRQLSEDQLKSVIAEIAAGHEKSMKSMGKIMAELKDGHGGEYDGKLASQIVKNILSA